MPAPLPDSLNLLRGETVLGTIAVDPKGTEAPWFRGTFSPAPGFEPVRELFERELRLLRAIEDDDDDDDAWEEWEAVHEELHEPGLQLSAPGYQLDEILLHINGAEAWWRTE